MSDKEQTAIERLKTASNMSLKLYKQPLVVTTSGGKDSSVCVYLAQKAGIPFEVQHNHTTADAPETFYFIRDEFKRLESLGIKCSKNAPLYKGKPTSMWKLIEVNGPPNRFFRFCCNVLKEHGQKNRFIATGVRWAESVKRKNSRGVYETYTANVKNRIVLNNDNDENRRLFETCQLKAKRICNPIIDWDDRDVWDYIQAEHIPINPLYTEGWARVGCIGCPMGSKRGRYKQFARWPKYKHIYLTAFEKYIQNKILNGGIPVKGNLDDLWHWWMEDGVLPGQMAFEDLEGDNE